MNTMDDLERWGYDENDDSPRPQRRVPDGYWTPWHVARARITALEAEALYFREESDRVCIREAHLKNTVERLKADKAGLVEASNRCIQIVERNLHRQNEKVDDVPHILRAALEQHGGGK